MDKLFSVGQFLKYKITGGTPHDVHSPFVFEFLNNVIREQTPFYSFQPIESLRAKLLLDDRMISVTDYGSLSTGKTVSRKINSIAKKSLQEAKYAQLIFRIVNFSKANSILEMGTSLGITSLYISNAAPKSHFITLEGCPEIAKIGRHNFGRMKCQNIELIIGNFKETLPSALNKFNQLDLVYFDGNHTKQATLDYFNLCIEKKTADSIFIFDDIYWSKEMKSAWDQIKLHNEVSLSIDLYKLGIIFFRKGIEKQHFQLKF